MADTRDPRSSTTPPAAATPAETARGSHHDPKVEAKEQQSIGTLLKELTDETSTLVREEITLAKTEMSEQLRRIGADLGSLVTGAVLLVGALLLLLAAVNLGLIALFDTFMDEDVAMWLAPLVLAAVVGLIGFGMVKKGKEGLQRDVAPPRKTIDSVKQDAHMVKEKV